MGKRVNRSLLNIIITSLAYNMNQKQLIFFMILLSAASIVTRSIWTNTFTTVIMAALILATLFVIIKDAVRRR
ncbi:hypothetical protein EJB14_09890 [Bacillus pumilus]|nr:hypothetical protein C6Y05_16995 [Bacillus sp. LNXM10]PRS53527.1 hypothetical protein C6Y06_06075 [Bacillus sp. MZGC1]RST66813.1 hypothetical protein EJB14_09890 [Bacillus pumilus]